MKITIISAMDGKSVIGFNGNLPWGKLPGDMKHFQKTTWGHPVIMGRKTHVSIGMVLKNRVNIIMSRDTKYQRKGCLVAHTVEDALAWAEEEGTGQVFIIGGGEIYRLFLSLADELIITFVQGDFPGDTTFPPISQGQWRQTNTKHSNEDAYPYDITRFQRIRI